MQTGSTAALAEVLEETRRRLGSGTDAATLGDDLFAVVLTLDERHSLRRALTEPAVPPDAKASLVDNLLRAKIGEAAVGVVQVAARHRWSRGRDLADALERASISAHVAVADSSAQLDGLEDDLFRFGRIVEATPRLREVLVDPEADLQGKRELLDRLLGDKVGRPTLRLLGQVAAARHGSLAKALEICQQVAADHRDQLVATVTVAARLSDEHHERLQRVLSLQYSREVHVNVVVDPAVLGGARVAVGDEVIDSTIASRLAQAHRSLEG